MIWNDAGTRQPVKRQVVPDREAGDDDDHVSMTAYDTTEEDEDDEYISAGTVILSGLVELMESDFERVMQGVWLDLPLRQQEKPWSNETGNGVDVQHDPDTNIVKFW